MKATYDPKTDTLTLELAPGPVAESDEDKPGVILDYDADGNLIGIEVLDASQRVAQVQSMEFQVAG
jgi:YD repeat-containing protein